MDIQLEKIATHIIVLLVGTVYAKIIKTFKDLDASFKKLRDLESRVKNLEEKSDG